MQFQTDLCVPMSFMAMKQKTTDEKLPAAGSKESLTKHARENSVMKDSVKKSAIGANPRTITREMIDSQKMHELIRKSSY